MRSSLVLLVLAALIFSAGCTGGSSDNSNSSNNNTGDVNLTGAQNGDLVSVDYIGTLDNGTVFDTSIESEAQNAGLPLRSSYEPLEFTVGAGQMIAGFDAAVIGMKEGEEKNVHLAPADAYGEKRQDLIAEIPKANVPVDAFVGSKLSTSNGMSGVITAIGTENITIDFNHELAGKALNFRIFMRKITKQ